jgi:hypothetical protein
MALLTHDQILHADDRKSQIVAVPEWGGEVLVRGLSGRGRDEYFAAMTTVRAGRPVVDTANATARLVAGCIVGEDGLPMFSEPEIADLGEKSGAALDRVFSVAQRLSGLSEEDMAELGKGSVSTPNGSSTSAPPPPSGARSRSSSTGSPPSS